MLDPRLKTLQLVTHLGSVTEAARALHFTPSAVSQQLRSLSEEFDVALTRHVGRRMEATAAGRTLLRHVETLQAQAERARAELADGLDLTRGIGLCGFSTAAATVLAPAAAALREQFPGLTVRVVEAEPERCVDLLVAEECDLALLVVDERTPPATDPRFDQRPVLDDPIDLAVPVGHRLLGRARVTLRDAASESWIAARPGSAYHRLCLSACRAAGFQPGIAHEADEWDTGAALVAHGLGIFLLPRLAPLHRTEGVARVRLGGPSAPVRRVVAVTRKGSATLPTIAAALEAVAAAVPAALEE